MKKKKLNIRLLALLLLVIGIVLVAIGFWLFAPKSQLIDDTFEITGNQSFSLKSRDKLNDEDGLKQFNTIRIKNVSDDTAYYRLTLTDVEMNGISRSDIKVAILKNGEFVLRPVTLDTLSSTYLLLTKQEIASSDTDELEISFWITDETNVDTSSASFKGNFYFRKINTSEANLEDKTAPVIMLNGDYQVKLLKGSEFTDPGVAVVTDNVDDSLTVDQVQTNYYHVNGEKQEPVDQISTATVGVYIIEYSIVDDAGNEGQAIRTVSIFENQESLDASNTELTLDVSYSNLIDSVESVTVTITSSKQLLGLSGWVLSEDMMSISKTFTSNINVMYVVVATDGSSELVTVTIDNILENDVTSPENPGEETPVTPTPPIATPDENVDPLSVSLNVASQTASSVTLNASVSDPSRVQEYYYLCGYTWSAATTDSSYTCSNLSINTSLPFQVRVVDRLGGGSYTSDILTVTLQEVTKPVITTNITGWASKKTVTITYPEVNGATYQYRIDGNTWNTVSTSTSFDITSNCTIEARILSGSSEVLETFYESMIDTVAPTISDGQISFSQIGDIINHYWTPATDNITDALQLKYYVCLAPTSTFSVDDCIGQYLLDSGIEMTSYIGYVPFGYLGVVVEDAAGNRSMYNPFMVQQ